MGSLRSAPGGSSRLERARTVTVSADRHAGDHLHDAGFGRIRLHLRQRECGPDHGLLSLGDARGSGILVFAFAPRGRPARRRRDGSSHRARRWESRVSVPQQSRKLYLDPRHLQGHPRRERPSAGDCWLLGGHFLPQAGGAGSRRAHGHHEGPTDARRCQSIGHLHDHAISGRLCLPVREREFDADHGVSAVGDARQSALLGQACPF